MIDIKEDNNKFNYRVVGVLIDGDKVLMQKRKNDRFWALPGGRGEMMEISKDTIKREYKEELKITIDVGRLLWVAENFFNFNNTNIHEISFYYLVSLQRDEFITKLDEFNGIEEGKDIIFKWFDLSSIKDAPIKPKFLNEELLNIDESIKHFIVVE